MKNSTLTSAILISFIFLSNFIIAQEKAGTQLLTSKRYKEAIIERDDLCSRVKELSADTLKWGEDFRKLSSEKDDLLKNFIEIDKKHKELISSSLNQTQQLNQALKQKSDELMGKEKLLIDREQKLKELQEVINRQDSIVNALNRIVKNALLGFNDDELTVEMKNGNVYVSMSDKLLFKSGSAAVEDKGKDALKKVADVLNRNPEIAILVEGHTDSIPIKTAIFKDNWDLSVARATSIVRMFSNDYKVDNKRLTASGKGEFLPIGANATPEGRAKNRRTEIILSPKLDELFQILQAK
ncbi:MAG: OmpA family protein [Bacteroidetes bacterium]|nr:OmpA family protein [Bacteroidota bacterium]